MVREGYNRLSEKRKRKMRVSLKFVPEDIGRKTKNKNSIKGY